MQDTQAPTCYLGIDISKRAPRRRGALGLRTASPIVTNDIEVDIRHLTRCIDELVRQAIKVLCQSDDLQAAYDRLVSVPGIARKNAVLLLGELALLPRDMSVRQWGAHAGLDPKRHQSGASVEEREHTREGRERSDTPRSDMPALAAVRHDRHIGAFYEKLLARGKRPIVATVAVMRWAHGTRSTVCSNTTKTSGARSSTASLKNGPPPLDF